MTLTTWREALYTRNHYIEDTLKKTIRDAHEKTDYKKLAQNELILASSRSSSDIYLPFGDILIRRFELPCRDFEDQLWEEMTHRVTEEQIPYAADRTQTTTLLRYFREFFRSYAPDFAYLSDDDIDTAYRAMLAGELQGTMYERKVFRKLRKEFQNRVHWGTQKEESLDIDFYIDGIPVSMKSMSGFREDKIIEHRIDKGKTSPLLYINEKGKTATVEDGTVIIRPREELRTSLNIAYKQWKQQRFDILHALPRELRRLASRCSQEDRADGMAFTLGSLPVVVRDQRWFQKNDGDLTLFRLEWDEDQNALAPIHFFLFDGELHAAVRTGSIRQNSRWMTLTGEKLREHILELLEDY